MANRVGYEYWVVQTDVVEPHKIGIEADIGDGIYDLGLKNLDEVKRTMGLCYLPDGSREDGQIILNGHQHNVLNDLQI